jgi:acetyltransferase
MISASQTGACSQPTMAPSARIAFSHTAAMLSDNKVVEAAFHQAGAIRVQDFEEVVNYLKIMTLPRLRGNRLAVISRSGGHAVVAADACSKYGFHLPAFPRVFEESKTFSASVITLSNPGLGDLFDPPGMQIMEETPSGRILRRLADPRIK